MACSAQLSAKIHELESRLRSAEDQAKRSRQSLEAVRARLRGYSASTPSSRAPDLQANERLESEELNVLAAEAEAKAADQRAKVKEGEVEKLSSLMEFQVLEPGPSAPLLCRSLLTVNMLAPLPVPRCRHPSSRPCGTSSAVPRHRPPTPRTRKRALPVERLPGADGVGGPGARRAHIRGRERPHSQRYGAGPRRTAAGRSLTRVGPEPDWCATRLSPACCGGRGAVQLNEPMGPTPRSPALTAFPCKAMPRRQRALLLPTERVKHEVPPWPADDWRAFTGRTVRLLPAPTRSPTHVPTRSASRGTVDASAVVVGSELPAVVAELEQCAQSGKLPEAVQRLAASAGSTWRSRRSARLSAREQGALLSHMAALAAAAAAAGSPSVSARRPFSVCRSPSHRRPRPFHAPSTSVTAPPCRPCPARGLGAVCARSVFGVGPARGPSQGGAAHRPWGKGPRPGPRRRTASCIRGRRGGATPWAGGGTTTERRPDIGGQRALTAVAGPRHGVARRGR